MKDEDKTKGELISELAQLRHRIAGLESSEIKYKRGNKQPRQGEESFRAIVETAEDAIIMLNNEGKISYWNPASEKIFGYASQEVIGKDIQVIIPERYHKDYNRGFATFRETGRGPAVWKKHVSEAIRKDGTEFPVEISVSAVQIMDRWCASGVVRDITDRKHIEETLTEMAEKYMVLFNMQENAVMLLDSETYGFLEINKAAEALYGYSRDEFLKMKAIEVGAHPGKIDVGITKVGSQSTGETLNSMHKKKDGTIFPVEISGTAFLWKNRKTIYAKVRDVTEPERREGGP